MTETSKWAGPNTTRSRVVLEVAAELVGDETQRHLQAKVLLREAGSKSWTTALLGSGTIEGIDEVVDGRAALALVNPTAALMMAYLGTGPYSAPQPVNTIAVIPTADAIAFVVRPETKLSTLEEIAERRSPLNLALRGNAEHSLNFMLEAVANAAGFSLNDIPSWGGTILRKGSVPYPDGDKFQSLLRGEIDAIFDEGAWAWVDAALDAGMTVLPLSEKTVAAVEQLGCRRSLLSRAQFPKLSTDMLTIDFSGWPIFVHAQAPDDFVVRICAALEARSHLIPWQGDGPLPLHRMCSEAVDTPQQVPLHPAAERFWRDRGYACAAISTPIRKG